CDVKVFTSADIEGIAGVMRLEQCNPAHADYAAAADATEYAVLDALLSAEGVSGFLQHARAALGPLLDRLAAAN
uniref:M55 family metallopeptidase n=1 Tax=Serratia nevei TaxID=2703794 RepID=UPI001FD1C4EE